MLSIVVGTRPECIKVAPLVKALKDLSVPHQVIHTNQHQDLWKGSGLTPDVFLAPSSCAELKTVTEDIAERLVPIIGGSDVLVQGDTLSAYAGASRCMGRILHLEAGVRSGDLNNPYPEEGIRRSIDLWASLAFCATSTHIENLKKEGQFIGKMFLTGNTGVDACLSRQNPVPLANRHPGTVLMTLHRRESFGEPLRHIIRGISEFARAHGDLQVHWPLHPNPEIQNAYDPKDLPKNVKIGPPLAYSTFLNKLAHARFVVTDSGGVQEDACTLGIPCVVAREVTDRPESVDSGQAVVCGRTQEGVIEGMLTALRGDLKTDPSQVYGDGNSSVRIAQLIKETL